MQAAVDGKPYAQQYPIDSAQPDGHQGNRRFGLMEEDRTQRMEIGRTGRIVLGYDYPRICA